MQRVAVAVVLLGGLAWDLARPPAEQWSALALLGGIDLYQLYVSERVERAGVTCRFRPSCSHYSEAVIRQHGALVGVGLAVWRILRCGPWTPADTEDPP